MKKILLLITLLLSMISTAKPVRDFSQEIKNAQDYATSIANVLNAKYDALYDLVINTIKALEDHDLVFIHVEAPDEAGHSGDADAKKLAIERIDQYIVGPVHDALKKYDSYRILVMPDHPTPVETQAHSADPVPFAMAGEGIKGILQKPFNEENGRESGFRIERGCDMMEYFLKI